MIKPNKTIKLSYSIIGVGALILPRLTYPQSVSALWNKLKKYKEITSFEKFVLTLDFLYMFNFIKFYKGLIMRVKND